MTLIKISLRDFERFTRNTAFNGGENQDVSLHPVSYFDFEPRDGRTIIAFYKPIGSFIYCVEVDKTNLPPDKTIEGLIREMGAIELTFPLYHYHTEQHGRIFV